MTRPPVDSLSKETMEILQNTIVPSNDPRELACRLANNCNVPEVMATTAAPRQIGETDMFWVSNLDDISNTEVSATLQYSTPHVYFWVQDGVDFDEDEMKAWWMNLKIRSTPPTVNSLAVNGHPALTAMSIFTFFIARTGFQHRRVFLFIRLSPPVGAGISNGHEMFLFNADNTELGDNFTYGVLAHEFQHMIHWKEDGNETSWLNEGSSELAAFLNGYDPGGFDFVYIGNPDLQLNDWPNDQNCNHSALWRRLPVHDLLPRPLW
jgi:immune inhibitor A